MKNYIKPTKLPNPVEFDQRRALSILEQFGSGRFEVVMDYCCHDARHFYESSVEFVRAKKKYKRALEQEFKVWW